MRTIRSRGSAAALLAVLTATLLHPLAAFARVSAPKVERHGCHCPVKMACCEAGLCHGGMGSTPSSGPSWSGCRDEAPPPSAAPAPSSVFDGALLTESAAHVDETGARFSVAVATGAESPGPPPATPPPRNSIASC
jgi:hypothetical protein